MIPLATLTIARRISEELLIIYNNAFYAVNERQSSKPGYKTGSLIKTKKINGKIEMVVR